MKTGRIINRGLRQAWFLAQDPDICAVQHEEEVAVEIAEIDRLVEEVERDLAEVERVVLVRLTHDFTDQRRAVRAARRAERNVLRGLPFLLDADEVIGAVGGEAA